MAKTSQIKSIKAREILDSRGNPTVSVELATDQGVFQDSSPSGASKGKHAALELRDGGRRYRGMGVLGAVNNINKIIAPKLKGKDPSRQKELDDIIIKLDGTKNKSKLGANAIVAVSMAICRAGAEKTPLFKYIAQLARNKKLFLPEPCFNIINGGVHAGGGLDIQEIMITPQKINPYSRDLRAGSEIYYALKEILFKKFKGGSVNVGDEGGFVPPVKTTEEALDLIMLAISKAGYLGKIKIALDCAATQFCVSGSLQPKYKIEGKKLNFKELLSFYQRLIKKYPIISIEDPFAEEDWQGFKEITKELGRKIRIIGDDFLVTNPERIKKAHNRLACNGLLLKVNQIGTVTEAIEAGKLAKSYNWKVMVSHRSGETKDDFIADLAVGIGADYIKAGAPARGERLAKYNRLLRIEEELKK